MSTAAKDIAFQAPVELKIAAELARIKQGYVQTNGKGKNSRQDFVLLTPVRVEVKCDYRAKETRNVYLETRNCYRNEPSGLTATKAAWWIQYVPGDAVAYQFNPRVMLDWLKNKSGLQPITECGDNNSEGYLLRLVELAKLPFVKTIEMML